MLAKASISISNTISAHVGKVFFKILNLSGANMNDAANYVADLGEDLLFVFKANKFVVLHLADDKTDQKILENIIFWKDWNIIET